MALETRLAAAHWDKVRCRDVLATYNLTTLDELRAAAPAFDWPGWITALGGTEEQFAEVLVRQPSYLRGDLGGAHRGPARRLEDLAHVPSGPTAPRPT